MKKIVLSFFLFISIFSFSQENKLKFNRPFVIFEGCDEAEDKERCYDIMLSEFFAKKLNTTELKERVFNEAKKDTVIVSSYLVYNELGSIVTNFSRISLPLKDSKKETLDIMEQLPSVKPVLDKYNNGVSEAVGSIYGFLLDRNNDKVVPILGYEPEVVPFAIIEKVPIYKGCDKNLSNEDLRKCMGSKISEIVIKNFKSKLAGRLRLSPGYVKIFVTFKINKDGKVIDIKARATHPKLADEAIRVIKKIPKMDAPGYQRGKAVIVPYTLPIMFAVD
ncbi:energy transducer TonB [Winogradskyella haliclonae]|uniref:TonB C-terminal domain-containing protein n=1 Tax=Winogradskyella haliclonae TaxID=2048558 RepID=A0ABQ2BW58_9FLAO|nr:energy transducer TonB [Winogradskyella haliclonae]GGI56640.1 hypothetical protein GCM10011444_09490 [Winogradskyella haliclonae]